MSRSFRRALSYKFIAATVSGATFLLIALGIRALPERFVAAAVIEAPEMPLELGRRTAKTLTTQPQGDRGRWRVEVAQPDRRAAEELLSSVLAEWESRTKAAADIEPSNVASLQATLAVKKPLLAAQEQRGEDARRRIEALDAAAFALKARMEAARANAADYADPIGELLSSLQELQATLATAFPPEHRALRRLSQRIADLRAAAMSQAQAKQTAKQLAQFDSDLQNLTERYAPGHPEVQRKNAEIEAIERHLQSLQEGSVPIVPLYGEVDVARRERDYWQVELRALESAKTRWADEMGRIGALHGALQQEVSDLETALRDEKARGKPTRPFRVVSAPLTRAVHRAPGSWVPWALAAALSAGLCAALVVNGGGKKVWAPEDLPSGPWAEGVFCTPLLPTPWARGIAGLRATVAVVPWAIALSFFS